MRRAKQKILCFVVDNNADAPRIIFIMTNATTNRRAYESGFETGRDLARYRRATVEAIALWDWSQDEELILNAPADALADTLGLEFEVVVAGGAELELARESCNSGHRAGAMFQVAAS